MLPSNRETGCLSDTRIKMDALYFPPCSVREQGETEGEEKREEEEEWRHTCRGHDGRYKERGEKNKGQYAVRSFLHPKPVIRENIDSL